MDLLNDILKTQKLAREDKIKSFQSMFSEEPVAVKQANIKAQQVQELEDLKLKQEKELEALKDRHERTNERLGLEKEKESQNIAIQKQRDAARKANESVDLEESKVTCPKCKGKGCDHCDNTGYHIKEGKLVNSFRDIIKIITQKVAERLEKEYSGNPEKGLGMINTIGAMIGYKVTDKEQEKGKLFLKFGEEVEEGYYSDKNKRQQDTLKKHDKRMIKISRDSIKKYEKDKKKSVNEVRAKQAVSQGKVQKLVTAHGLQFKGKKYDEIDMELKGINNNTKEVTFNIIHPKEIFGNEVKLTFNTLRRGPFMATDTSKINSEEKVEEDRDYKKEYESYHSDPEQIKRRAKRNEARRSLKNSKELTSDKDVHHKDNNPMNNDKSNLSIVTQNYNRKEPRMRDKLKEKGCLPNAKRK